MLTTLACLLGIGWLLVPAHSLRGQQLLLLAVRLASGIVFVAGFSALFCLRHLHYMTWIAIGQVLAAGWLWRNPASPHVRDPRAVIPGALPIRHHRWVGTTDPRRPRLLRGQRGGAARISGGQWMGHFHGQGVQGGRRDAWYHWGALMLVAL